MWTCDIRSTNATPFYSNCPDWMCVTNIKRTLNENYYWFLLSKALLIYASRLVWAVVINERIIINKTYQMQSVFSQSVPLVLHSLQLVVPVMTIVFHTRNTHMRQCRHMAMDFSVKYLIVFIYDFTSHLERIYLSWEFCYKKKRCWPKVLRLLKSLLLIHRQPYWSQLTILECLKFSVNLILDVLELQT